MQFSAHLASSLLRLCDRAVRSAAEEGGRRQRLAGVNREKVHKHESFSTYAKAVLRRASGGGGGKRGGLGEWVDERVSEILETDLNAEFAAELTCWHRPAIFYALRLMMAPAIESLLLLDRLIFLSAYLLTSFSILTTLTSITPFTSNKFTTTIKNFETFSF